MIKKGKQGKSSAKPVSWLEEKYDFFMEGSEWKQDFEELLKNPIVTSGPDTPERIKIIDAFMNKHPEGSKLFVSYHPPVVTIPYHSGTEWEPDPSKPGQYNCVGEDHRKNLFPSLPERDWIKIPRKVKSSDGNTEGRFLLLAVDLTDGMRSILANFTKVVRFYKGGRRVRVEKMVEAIKKAKESHGRKKREEIKGTPKAVEQERRRRKSKAASDSRLIRRGRNALK